MQMLLKHISSLSCPHSESSLNLKRIFELYEVIASLNKDSELLILYVKNSALRTKRLTS